MSGTDVQDNNKAVVFKGKSTKEARRAHKRGLISDKELGKLKQKDSDNESR